MDDLTNKFIRGYQIKEILGTGGFGVVYLAHQPVIDRDVAIKAILPEYANKPDFVRRFEREARFIARLEHLHIVPIYDFWRDPSGAYLVMRYLKGSNLGHALFYEGPWSLKSASRLIEQTSSALGAAHRYGIVHQDIKPENILLDADENGYLTDFGIARDLGDTEDTGVEVYGSPAYLSPERARGEEVNHLSDIYSFGLLVYALLVGDSPFIDSSVGKMLNHAKYTPAPPIHDHRPGLVPAVDIAIQKATAKTPADRYLTVEEFANDILRALEVSHDVPEVILKSMSPAQIERMSKRSNRTLDGKTAIIGGETEAKTSNLASGTIHLGSTPVPRSSMTAQLPNTRKGTTPHKTSRTIDMDTGQVVAPTAVLNPYIGLRPFEEADALNFHGRAGLIDQLVKRLEEDMDAGRFLALVGASGSGKSSVVRAGLIPALRFGILPGSERWFVTTMVPGPKPLVELEQALLSVAYGTFEDSIEEKIRLGRTGLHEVIKRLIPGDDAQILLFIDQFEEIFTQASDADRMSFLNNIIYAIEMDSSKLRVIITLRADFYDRPLLIPDFGDLMRKRTEVILPLNEEELSQAIIGPAQNAGLEVEEALTKKIIQDVGIQPAALPLLQFALTELFEERVEKKLTLEAYINLGGVSGALARRADALYRQFDGEEQAYIRTLFLRLIALGTDGNKDTRRRTSRAELLTISENTGQITGILDLFGRFRLLTFDRDQQSRLPTVEIAHESLISEWDLLRGWIDSSRDVLRTQRELQIAAQEWQTNNRDRSYLPTGTRLAAFEQLLSAKEISMSDVERQYLQAGIDQRQQTKNRQRMGIAGLIVATLVATFLALIALEGQRQAQQAEALALIERDRANEQAQISHSRELALAAISDRNRLDTALLLSLEAIKTHNTLEARRSLLTNLTTNPQVERFFAADAPLRCVAVSSDGRIIAAGGDNGIHLWQLQDGAEIIGNHALDSVLAIAMSQDDRWIATAHDDGTINLWQNTDLSTPVQVFDAHTSSVRALAFSPDGSTLASGDDDGLVILWDLEDGTEQELFGHADSVFALDFNQDGTILASGSADQNILLWQLDNVNSAGEPAVTILQGHQNWVLTLAFHPTENILASSGPEGIVYLWNAASGTPLGNFRTGHTDWVRSLDFSPDGAILATASADNTTRLWDLSSGQAFSAPLTGHVDALWSVRFMPDGSHLVTTSLDSSAILWNIKRTSVLGTLLDTHEGPVWTVIRSPDGRFAASAGGDTSDTEGDFAIRLWHVSGEEKTIDSEPTLLAGHTAAITAMAITPQGEHLISGSADGQILSWDLSTDPMTSEILSVAHEGGITALAVSQDGSTLLSGDDNGVLMISTLMQDGSWEDTNHVDDVHAGGITAITFSPDGRWAATAGRDNQIQLWQLDSGRMSETASLTLQGHEDDVQSLSFSPDSQLLASGGRDNTIMLWDVNTGERIAQPLRFHTHWVNAVQFSPDGKTIASASRDGTVLLWDVQSRQPLGPPLRGHQGWVNTLAYDPDGRWLLSGGFAGDLFLWRVDLAQWRQTACSIANRNLTTAEWNQYLAETPYQTTCS